MTKVVTKKGRKIYTVYPTIRANVEFEMHIIKDVASDEKRMDAIAKPYFKRGSKWMNRIGEYEVTWVGDDGIKIKYTKVNPEALAEWEALGYKHKTKKFITDGYATMRRIHQNTMKEILI